MSDFQETYGGRYAVIERVGTGGMAEVYRARDQLLGRQVALKVLSRRLSNDRSFIERFRREAQAAANLNHPNVVSLYDYGSEDGSYYIVMEFIQGRSLDEVIAEAGALLPERAAEIAADVARALERAHLSGLVHRDIKPANIMITDSGGVKVTDFGIVRALAGNGEQTMTQTGMVIGTAAYLSPEQAQGHRVDARSDVYSLGVVLYEMLAGEPPFAGETPLSVVYKHVRENPRPPSAVNPDVPDALDSIVMKALAKNPDNRYSSALEMREDLERFAQGETVSATPVMPTETMMAPGPRGGTRVIPQAGPVYEEPERRRRAWPAVLVVLLVLGVAALIAFLLANNVFAPTVEVPKLVGETQKQAIADLKRAGLGYNVDRQPSRAPVDHVYDQDPNAGTGLHKGDDVTLFVSTGPKEVVVPDLTGKTVGEAKAALKHENLTLGSIDRQPSDTVDRGHVISQQYPSGDKVPVDTEVGITVSSGPATVLVPDVVGESEEQARSEIEAVGLVPDFSTQPSNDVSKGTVISQDPAGNETANKGDTVSVLVSSGPESQSMPNVVGEDADQAEAQLRNDFGLEVRREVTACPQPPGTVCDQDPSPGSPVQPGDTATLFVQPGGGGEGSPSGSVPLPGLIRLLLSL